MLSRTLAVAALAMVATAGAAQARDQIRIVGSSTVYPFSTAVAEQFGKGGKFKTPVVESTGTGGGMRLFCSGVGETFPDITNASRRITTSELEACAKNGVTGITEVMIGYDGIVAINAKGGPKFVLTRDQMYKATAKDIPVGGKLVPNPYKSWSDIDPSLPKEPILVYGPAPNHGTRDAYVELVLDPACEKQPEIKALDKDAKKKACQAVREDGAWVEVSENYTVIQQKITANPAALGVITFSYIDQNADKIQAATMDGVTASFETIASGKYPVSRPLFFYVKKQHAGMVPGIKEYLAEFTAEKTWGKEGYLVDKGLIAAPDAQRKEQAANAKNLGDLKM
ncbi:ABC-type phosphate transport system [Candidatus Terasakiella magnetica]|nr:ABC-type phosphate transport system [Candidatus Terasakiella magnetica]